MRREVEIVNELGLHARPAAEFVRIAQGFDAEVLLIKDGQTFAADSIMEVLTAGIGHGAKLILEARGPEEAAVLERLAEWLALLPQLEAEGR